MNEEIVDCLQTISLQIIPIICDKYLTKKSAGLSSPMIGSVLIQGNGIPMYCVPCATIFILSYSKNKS